MRNPFWLVSIAAVLLAPGLSAQAPDPSPKPRPAPVPPEPRPPRPPAPGGPSGAPRSPPEEKLRGPSVITEPSPPPVVEVSPGGLPSAAGVAGALRAPDAASELFDFSRFLQVRSAWGPSLSPDGQRVAFITNIPGLPQIFRLDGPGRWPHQVTFHEDYVSFVEWAPAGEDRLVFGMSPGGSAQWQLYEVKPNGEGLRPIAPAPGSVNRMGAFSRDGKRLAFSSNRRDKANFDLYVYDFETRQHKRILEGRSVWEPIGFSPDGKKLLAARSLTNWDNDLFLVDVDGGSEKVQLITPHVGEVRFESPHWSPDGKTIYMACDMGRDFLNLAALDLATGAVRFLLDEPFDVDELAVSADGRRIAVTTNVEGSSVLRVLDVATLKVIGQPKLPRGIAKGLVMSRDGKRLTFAFSGATYTSDIWTFDVEKKTLTQDTFSPHAGIHKSVFVEPELVRWPTFDGRELSGWLYKPKDLRFPPVVLWIHGGPESQERADFSAVMQYLVHRGLAIFAPNIRGSLGYGKAFAALDDKEKRVDALRDIEVAVRMLRARQDVDGTRLGVMGGSYGGYMTLLALTRYNELFAAGVDIAGFASLISYFKLTEPWRVPIRAREYGDPATQAELLMALSPLKDAHKIKAPLMVIQGANDTRVPPVEAEQVVAAVKAHQVPVEYILFPDEGHGVVKLSNRLVAWKRVGDFLVKHLAEPGKTALK